MSSVTSYGLFYKIASDPIRIIHSDNYLKSGIYFESDGSDFFSDFFTFFLPRIHKFDIVSMHLRCLFSSVGVLQQAPCGGLEKRLTHMPFTHTFTGSNPVSVTMLKCNCLQAVFLLFIHQKIRRYELFISSFWFLLVHCHNSFDDFTMVRIITCCF